MKIGLILTLLVLAAAETEAAIEVVLSANPVDCKDPFDIIAKFSTDTGNAQVVFYVDNLTVDSKNINGEAESKATFTGEDNWDRLQPGSHKAKVDLMKGETTQDEGSLVFEVAGRRCPETTTTTTASTTTTTLRFACTSNVDCNPPSSEPITCTGRNVTQRLIWGECENASTPYARCVDKEETAIIKECEEVEDCEGGECRRMEPVTTTVTSSTATATTPPTTTEPTIASTTSTSYTTTSTQPQTETPPDTEQPIFGRTNTRLDALMVAFEALIRFLVFWR